MLAASLRLRRRTPLGITATFAELCSSFTLLQSTVISPSASLLKVREEPDDFTKCPVSLSPSVNSRTSASGLGGAAGCPRSPTTPSKHIEKTQEKLRTLTPSGTAAIPRDENS